MNWNTLRKVIAVGLLVVSGHSWATVSAPADGTTQWQDISSIQWSTDNGTTWGNSALAVGQSVEFKFTMHKDYTGLHFADFIKAWIDLDGNEIFTESETLLFGHHEVNSSYQVNNGPGSNVEQYFDFTTKPSASAGAVVDYTSGPLLVTSSMVGDHYLLARVTCSETLVGGNWGAQWNTSLAQYRGLFLPMADYSNGQGESELIRLSVNGHNVPEPGTLALVAVALVGMGLRRKLEIRP